MLGLVVAEALVRARPDDPVGVLTPERARLVSRSTLAAWAMALGLPACLRLGRGEAQSGGAGKESILATAFEAIVGALYLEGGLEAVRALLARLTPGARVESGPGAW